ncbi:MAG: hypothetical protein JWO30_3974 [Fibrobacteres bacterium]|nr:hypothetical protein [Fibrobacterota bacterium]
MDLSFHPLLVQAMRQHVGRAIKVMESRDEPEKIHVLRTGIKRMRASWRLLRPALPDSVFRRENHALKSASLGLGPLREIHVLGKTLRKLREGKTGKRGSRKKPAPIDEAWERLEATMQSEKIHVPDGGKSILGKTSAVLKASLLRFGRLDPETTAYRRLKPLLGRSYRNARKAGERALEQALKASDSGFHDWRKRVKDHFYQLEALKPLLTARADGMLEGLDRLQDALGDEHDLTVLDAYFRGHAGLIPDPETVRKAGETIAKELKNARKKSRRLGTPLFKEKPARYLGRMVSGGLPKKKKAGLRQAA